MRERGADRRGEEGKGALEKTENEDRGGGEGEWKGGGSRSQFAFLFF